MFPNVNSDDQSLRLCLCFLFLILYPMLHSLDYWWSILDTSTSDQLLSYPYLMNPFWWCPRTEINIFDGALQFSHARVQGTLPFPFVHASFTASKPKISGVVFWRGTLSLFGEPCLHSLYGLNDQPMINTFRRTGYASCIWHSRMLVKWN